VGFEFLDLLLQGLVFAVGPARTVPVLGRRDLALLLVVLYQLARRLPKGPYKDQREMSGRYLLTDETITRDKGGDPEARWTALV
jgi:hypothetical protein